MDALSIREDDVAGAPTRELLALHLSGMHADTPAGHVFALDVTGLLAPEVTVWTAWRGDQICGMVALKQLGPEAAEVKSMRTHPDHLRSGVAAALLDHLIEAAKGRGIRTLSLETGRAASFEPALALYRRRGFVPGERFGDYEASEFNQFFHMAL